MHAFAPGETHKTVYASFFLLKFTDCKDDVNTFCLYLPPIVS